MTTLLPFTPVHPINPALPYLGGKRLLAKRICAEIDKIPHRSYIEPFCGMGGVFFRRASRPKSEVINDLSRDVPNFFRIARKHPDALISELRFQITCRDDFERQKLMPAEVLTDIERAARFFFLQKCTFGGKVTNRSFGISRDGQPGRFSSFKAAEYIKALHERLERVVIEALPYQDILKRYDHPTALFYLDPPYWGNEADYGKGLFGKEDFKRMATMLGDLKGRFILSINDTPQVRKTFAEFKFHEVQTTYTIGKNRSQKVGELIITN